jgi:hypothetical protein
LGEISKIFSKATWLNLSIWDFSSWCEIKKGDQKNKLKFFWNLKLNLNQSVDEWSLDVPCYVDQKSKMNSCKTSCMTFWKHYFKNILQNYSFETVKKYVCVDQKSKMACTTGTFLVVPNLKMLILFLS